MAAVISDRPKKLQRISQACDLCHRRSIRCRPSEENEQHQCQNCYDFGVECTYLRPSRRRRNPSAAQASPTNVLPSQRIPNNTLTKSEGLKNEPPQSSRDAMSQLSPGSSDVTGAYSTIRKGAPEDSLGVAWRSFAAASLPKVEKYLKVYMEYVYPVFPVFHEQTLWDRLHGQHHLTDRGFFASIMAACALASARVRGGATALSSAGPYDEGPDGSSEVFFSAAQADIFKDLSKLSGFGVLRACGLLALTSIQYGQIHTMHQYMGYYHALSAMQQFHDEDDWPNTITMAEREERRRLFWAMYQLDVYIACVFRGMPHVREAHSNVNYPIEITDEQIAAGVTSPHGESKWLHGWNFSTDLYRVLEYTLTRMRITKDRHDRAPVSRMFISEAAPLAQIMRRVVISYHELPANLKTFDTPVTGTSGHDIFGFQMANIQATLQLARMTAIECDPALDGHEKCTVVEEILSTFREINVHYLKAISTPLVYHLGCIGGILASVISGVLNDNLYGRVRLCLERLADLLEGLESGLQPTAGAGKEIRSQIDKIDLHMRNQDREIANLVNIQQSMASVVNGVGAHAMPPGLSSHMPYQQSSQQMMGGMEAQPFPSGFQLPPELTGGWPWPFEFASDPNDHFLPTFSHEEER